MLVREWATARTQDQRDISRDITVQVAAAEERVMTELSRHQQRSADAHGRLDDRMNKVSDVVDRIDSALDQQRGARNILLFLVGTSILQLAGFGLALYLAVH